MEILNNVNLFITDIITNLGIYGIVFCCILIMIESILPFLPLSVFIAVIFLYYGPFVGFLISWFWTIVGCIISFFLFKKFKKVIDKKIRQNEKFNKILSKIDNLSLSNLVLLISIPWTPAFLVNIAAGISKIDYKKYILSLIIGKIILVYFWGMIGLTLIESIKNPLSIMKVITFCILSYIISKIVNKKFKID